MSDQMRNTKDSVQVCSILRGIHLAMVTHSESLTLDRTSNLYVDLHLPTKAGP